MFGHLGLPAAVGVHMPRLNARTYERVSPTVRAHLREQLAAAEEDLVGLLGPGFRWGD